jgi:DNA-binding SARP family transcriptional activator
MDFRILGPLEVLENGEVLDLGGQKQRALLAMLLLHANEVVSQDRLIEALWEDEPPETGKKALQVYVSQLRKALGRDRLVTKSPGYVLHVANGEFDLERFLNLQGKGKPQEALALWRGSTLSDFHYQRFAQPEIARLEELRLACLEERIGADLAQGRSAELVGELEALVNENPVRERLRAQLMLALYRSGRQAEALEAYQAARTALVEELGIEPGRQLRELHQAILQQDPALEPPAPVPPEGGPSRGVFVGREAELAELLDGLEEALSGRGRLYLIAGEPGIGKSRLADELIARARARGARILVGRCWEAGGAPAYWPWVQPLRAYVRDADPEAVRAQLGAGAADLAQIVPELRELFPDLPSPEPAESEAARFRLFDSTASFLRNASGERPIVLVLDDLHAADQPSLLLLGFLTAALADSRLLVVGTFRDVDPTVRDPLESTLAELGREPVTRRIQLSGLSEDDVRRLTEVTTGTSAPEAVVSALHAETEGNPLFVSEIVRLLAAEGRLDLARTTSIPIPASVREAIGHRLRRLSGECRRVLSLASVLGREFGLVALERVADYTGIDKLLAVLDEAIAARVIEEVPGPLGRLRFGHALIREALYEEIPATYRLRLHSRVAEVLEELYAGSVEAHLAELAFHFSMAVPAGSPSKAIEYASRAGDRAIALLAYEEAVRLYELALALVEDNALRCDLLLKLGDAQARAGHTPASKQTYREAAELATALDLPEQLARAALGYGGRFVWDVSRDDEYLVPLLERALSALGDKEGGLRVRLLARLAGGPLRDSRFPPERKVALGQEALGLARSIGDRGTLAYALIGYVTGHLSPDFTPRQPELATELIETSLQAGEKERAAEGYDLRFFASIELGEPGLEVELESITSLAAELRQPAQDWLAAVSAALIALLQGRLTEAERLVLDARNLGRGAQRWNAEASYLLQAFVLRRHQGRLREVDHLVRSGAAERPTYPICRCALALLAAELGQETEAAALLEALAADDFGALPFDEEWLVSMCLLAEVAASFSDDLRASTMHGRLLPYADRVAVSYPEISTGSVSRYLGLLASTLSRWDDATGHFEDALTMNERIGARPWLAHTQEDYGRMLLERGETERASELIASAVATYRELGMETYAARAQTLVEAYA